AVRSHLAHGLREIGDSTNLAADVGLDVDGSRQELAPRAGVRALCVAGQMRRGSDIKTEKGNAVDDQQPLELLAKKEPWMYGPHEAIRTARVRESAPPIRKQAVAPIQREIRLRVQSLEKAYVQDLEGRGPVG